ncbi:MAG: ImpA family metalloprotease [Gammaproteobacteria bacterium]|nr:ImpA family metalloprotease [Gammaproteobacteria bacterium]
MNRIMIALLISLNLMLSACSGDKAPSEPALSDIELALQQGDARFISNDRVAALEEATASEIENIIVSKNRVVEDVFAGVSINYDVGNRVALFDITDYDTTFPLLVGNASNKAMALFGNNGESRFAGFNTSLIAYHFSFGFNADMITPFKRVLSWLFAQSPLSTDNLNSAKNIVFSHFSTINETSNIEWLSGEFDQWQFSSCNDANTLTSCYQNKDLIFVSWEEGSDDEVDATIVALQQARAQGIPIIYMHSTIEYTNAMSTAIGDLLGFSIPYGGNFWADDTAVWASVAAMITDIQPITKIQTLLGHLLNNDISIDWADCADACYDNEVYARELKPGFDLLRSRLLVLDENAVDLFAQPNKRLDKLLVLLADKYREQIVYPMDKRMADFSVFAKALFADHAVYYHRKYARAQADLGSFSRNNFDHITPTTVTVNAKSHKPFRATGVYALPGKIMQVTRNDNSAVAIKVFINTLRPGSTHEFAYNDYTRAKYVQSPHFSIASGESISIVSPYGGPVQLEYDANDLDIELVFSNVGQHPFWDHIDDDVTFSAQVAANDYDWVEIITPNFEIHSTTEKMQETLANPAWNGSAAQVADATKRYLHDLPHALAGFQGDGITVPSEVQSFIDAQGWMLETQDAVKHMNADQALCGFGCSGNPYDAWWAYNPVSHGDGHEMGHSLEGSRIFSGWDYHAITNFYVFYAKSHYALESGNAHGCFNLPFQDLFTILQTSIGELDPAAYVTANLWDVNQWDDGAGVILQLMMLAQAQGALIDGWNLRPLLHALDREFLRAKVDETTWNNKRASLGMTDYTLAEADAMDDNDWLAIAIAFVTQRDVRDYLDMWAISMSDKARTQIANLGFAVMPRVFVASSNTGFCDTFTHSLVNIDGSSAWPLL